MLLKINLNYLFISLLLSAFLYPYLIHFLYKFQFREKIREELEHHKFKAGTPTMGGLGFVVITFIVNLLYNVDTWIIISLLTIFLIASIFGLLEDLFKSYAKSKARKAVRVKTYKLISKSKELNVLYKYLLLPWNLFRELARTLGSGDGVSGPIKSHVKLLMHLSLGSLIAFVSYYFLGWDSLNVPFLGSIYLGVFYPILITFLFVFTLNAVAITDGLDGLLAGLTLLILPVYWVIAHYLSYGSISNFIAILFGSLLVYLYFNVFPARVFMGDVGSYALASALFLIPFIMRVEFLLLITHFIPLFDGGISGNAQQLSVRLFKKRLFKMAPIHHHFEKIGWPETKVVIRFWIFQVLFSLLGLWLFFYI